MFRSIVHVKLCTVANTHKYGIREGEAGECWEGAWLGGEVVGESLTCFISHSNKYSTHRC